SLDLQLRGAVAREILAVAAAVLDDAEAVTPLFAVPAQRLALIDETGAIDRRHPGLAHRRDVDARERLQQRAEDRLVERGRAPERTKLENGFEHDTALIGRRAKRAASEGQASASLRDVASYSTAVPMMPPENVRVCCSGSTFVNRTMICMPTTAVFRLRRTPTPTSENIVAGSGSKLTDWLSLPTMIASIVKNGAIWL